MSGLSSSPSLLPMSWAASSAVHPSVVVQQVCCAFHRWESHFSQLSMRSRSGKTTSLELFWGSLSCIEAGWGADIYPERAIMFSCVRHRDGQERKDS